MCLKLLCEKETINQEYRSVDKLYEESTQVSEVTSYFILQPEQDLPRSRSNLLNLVSLFKI